MNDYPTEEELNRMIEELEREQLYAPKHLRKTIFLKRRKKKKEGTKMFSRFPFVCIRSRWQWEWLLLFYWYL